MLEFAMIKPPTSFVLFADMLGFKRLVLDNQVPYPENLDFRGRPASGARMSSLMDVGNPLSRGFTAFHGAVHNVLNTATFSGSLLVFSDSLFLATPEADHCFKFAAKLMRCCIMHEAPMRMGVGHGTFVSYGFSFEDSPQIRFLSSQFFGSGVVYATESEKALKGKGMRIAVHRVAAERLLSDGVREDRLLPVPENEALTDVGHEWNYLPHWPEVPGQYGVEEPDPEMLKNLQAHLDRMQGEADRDVQPHYEDTRAALDRMSAANARFFEARRRRTAGESNS